MAEFSRPPGWYPNPEGGAAQRYWDGHAWQDPAVSGHTVSQGWGERVHQARARAEAFVTDHKEAARGFVTGNKKPIAIGVVALAVVVGYTVYSSDDQPTSTTTPVYQRDEVDNVGEDIEADGTITIAEWVCSQFRQAGSASMDSVLELSDRLIADGDATDVAQARRLIRRSVENHCWQFSTDLDYANTLLVNFGKPGV